MKTTHSLSYYPSSAYQASYSDFFALLKPRVMSLVIFTGFVGLYVAPGTIHPVIALIAILCISIGSGAAGAINMWYDRDIDSIMSRTQNRPIPSGKILPNEALYFSLFLSCASVLIMALFVNFLSAALLSFAIVFYALVYTIWLKRRTPQNIVIGGASGAIPPIIGWTAVTGSIDIHPLMLFLIIFMWTPPHFWALSLCNSEDYKKARIPMLPLVSGIKSTQRHIFFYSVLLVLTTLMPYFTHTFDITYLCLAVFLGTGFLWNAYKLYIDPYNSLKLFRYSIIYLFLLFSGMILDKIVANLY